MTLIERKRPWASREHIEQMFAENKTLEVQNVLQKLEEKNNTNQLKDGLGKLKISDETQKEDKSQETFNLLERRHRGMQPRRQVAQSVTEDLYSLGKRNQPS